MGALVPRYVGHINELPLFELVSKRRPRHARPVVIFLFLCVRYVRVGLFRQRDKLLRAWGLWTGFILLPRCRCLSGGEMLQPYKLPLFLGHVDVSLPLGLVVRIGPVRKEVACS